MLPDRIYSSWIVAVDGSGAEEIVRADRDGIVGTLIMTNDGRTVFYTKLVAGAQQIFALDLSTRQSKQLTDSPESKFDLELSPDGRWIAVAALKDTVIQLFRMPVTGGPMQQLTTGFERMRHPFYSPDGRWIYIQPSHRNIYRVPAEGGKLEQVTHFPEGGLFLEEPAISPDGRYIYYCRGNGGSSLWLMTLGGSAGAAPGATASGP
jgi:TolB protein